ncbi:MAG: hypothetical protein GX801_00735 [Fibrobacter sp.]|nr:hypothetical protein [Fibrobacter sp.]
MNQALLYEVILGNKQHLFDEIWPIYKEFLESTTAAQKVEVYFVDKQELINDFYRWLSQKTEYAEQLKLIDRRSGIDRRGKPRFGAPGRRHEDLS